MNPDGLSKRDFNMTLIEEVKKRPNLYDPQLHEYWDGFLQEMSWMEVASAVGTTSKKPPFNIVAMEPHMFQNVTDYVRPFYRASCPIATRPLREIVFSQDKPQLFSYRISWNGPMDTAVVTKPVGKKTVPTPQALRSLYQQRLPIKAAKSKD